MSGCMGSEDFLWFGTIFSLVFGLFLYYTSTCHRGPQPPKGGGPVARATRGKPRPLIA